jgi:hypothetical protein
MAAMRHLFGGYSIRASLLHLRPARHLLRAEQRLALALLASVPHGVAEDLLVLAYGFDTDMIAGLVRPGLADPDNMPKAITVTDVLGP